MEKVQEDGKLKALFEISQIAARANDLDGLWQPLLGKVLSVLKADAGSFLELKDDCLVRKAVQGLDPNILEEKIPRSEGGISWNAVRTAEPQVVSHLGETKIASPYVAAAGFKSLVSVPMMVRRELVGVVSVFSQDLLQFSSEDLNFFTTIANQAGLAVISLKAAEILSENRRRMGELEALNQVSQSISTLFDFQETLHSIIASIAKSLRGDRGMMVLFDRRDHLLKAASPAFGLTATQVRDFRVRSDEGITGQAFCQAVPVMQGKLNRETADTLERAKIFGVLSVIAAPLKVKSQTLGVIQVLSKRENNFRPSDLRLFNILASQSAVVVNSSSMYREIAEERKKDAALLSAIGEGVLAIDKSGKIIHLNEAGENITGYLAEELLGKNFIDSVGLSNPQKIKFDQADSPISKVLADGQTLTLRDCYLRKRSGVLFPAYLTFSAILDADDLIIGVMAVFRDTSSETELEEMKRELISIATHELRSPITAIKGYLDMVLSGDTGPVSDETREALLEVVNANRRLADLVDDLLNVSRIEQGKIMIRPQAVDLPALIGETIKDYLPEAENKNIRLTLAQSDIGKVRADPMRLRQVLNNLISNAVKYTESGSVELNLRRRGAEVLCEVADTGIGISRENQKKLFSKFYRVRTPETLKIAGTGLGLWISRKLLEMMAGKIWLESQDGKGSTFYFTLPAA